MIGILLSAVLSSATGQVPAQNSMNSFQASYGGGGVPYVNGYPVSFGGYDGTGSSNTGNFGFSFGANGPTCSQGGRTCFGTFIGPYPVAASTCQNCSPMMSYPMQNQPMCPSNMSNMMGGFNRMGPPAYLPFNLPGMPISIVSSDSEKEHKEINRHLDEIKGALDHEVKGTLDKLTDSLKQLEKRLEAGEKISQSTEERVKWLKQEVEKRFFWHDMENKLDHRIKPIEERLHDLQRKLERFMAENTREHQGIKQMEKAAEGKGGDALRIIEGKIDGLQSMVIKDIVSIQTRLEQIEDALKAEKQRIDERLKNLEKNLPGAKELPKKEEPKEMPNKEKGKDKDAPKIELPKIELPKIELPKINDKDLPKGNDKEKAKGKDIDMEKEKENSAGLVRVRTAGLTRELASADHRATIIVSLPADARLYLNNQLTRAQGARRTFVTPALEPGTTFTYAFRIEVLQNGEVTTQSGVVAFRAGQKANIVFSSNR